MVWLCIQLKYLNMYSIMWTSWPPYILNKSSEGTVAVVKQCYLLSWYSPPAISWVRVKTNLKTTISQRGQSHGEVNQSDMIIISMEHCSLMRFQTHALERNIVSTSQGVSVITHAECNHCKRWTKDNYVCVCVWFASCTAQLSQKQALHDEASRECCHTF